MDKVKELNSIQSDFIDLSELLLAIGDETRQHLIMTMMKLPCKHQGGVRVGEITTMTHLSRPAVSHHLKILKDTGVIGVRRDGTKNFYFLETNGELWQKLSSVCLKIVNVIDFLNGGIE